MTYADDWTVDFYVTEAGDEPVAEFLRSLDQRTQVRFDWSIEQLRLRNIQAREPLVKHLEGKLWELRRERGTNIYRMLYVLLSNRRILFLHGFQKRTRKTPRGEIEIAMRRLADITDREGAIR